MATHDIGDAVRVTCTFRNEAGALANPTAVTLQVRAPSGTVTTVSNSSTGTGVYSGVVSPDAEGVWRYRFTGTGAVAQAQEGMFTVRRRRVPAA
jgi:uncharacterized protein YfaS (alpha-2-macroglobulin family)